MALPMTKLNRSTTGAYVARKVIPKDVVTATQKVFWAVGLNPVSATMAIASHPSSSSGCGCACTP